MHIVGDPQHVEGVFALVRVEPEKVALVGTTNDLRQRASIWVYNFKRAAQDTTFKLPARGLREFPLDGWEFWSWPEDSDGHSESAIRERMVQMQFRMLNKEVRHRGLITYKGNKKTIAEHARDAGVLYATAYVRWRRGKPLDEVFKP